MEFKVLWYQQYQQIHIHNYSGTNPFLALSPSNTFYFLDSDEVISIEHMSSYVTVTEQARFLFVTVKMYLLSSFSCLKTIYASTLALQYSFVGKN